jgi:hypothetical protein
MIVMPSGAPLVIRVNADPAYGEEAQKTFGFVPQWAAPRHLRGGAGRAHGKAAGARVPRGLHEEPAEVSCAVGCWVTAVGTKATPVEMESARAANSVRSLPPCKGPGGPSTPSARHCPASQPTGPAKD